MTTTQLSALRLSRLAACLLLAALISFSPVQAANHLIPNAASYVAVNPACPNGPLCFNSIQAAHNAVDWGGMIEVDPGVYSEEVNLYRDVTVIIKNGVRVNGSFQISIVAEVTFLGNFEVTGLFANVGILNTGGSTVIFDGQNEQTIQTYAATTFNNVTITPGTTLVEEVSPYDPVVAGTLTNLGLIRKTRPVSGAGIYNFGLTGVEINVQTSGDLSQIQVERMDSNHPYGSGVPSVSGTLTGVYWRITPTTSGAAPFSAILRLPHSLGDNYNLAYACRYTGGEAPGGSFDCDRSDWDLTRVWRANVSQFSTWTVGIDMEPTAATLARFEVMANQVQPAVWVAGAGLLVAVVARLLSSRRRRSI